MAVKCFGQEQQTDSGETDVDVFYKSIPGDSTIEESPEEDGRHRYGKRQKVVVRHGGSPQPCQPVSRHADQASRQEIGLERRTKVLRGPLPQRPINGQGGVVHYVSASENTGYKSAEEKYRG